MKVAILSCGRSVGLYLQFLQHYDIRIGINQIPEQFAVDWWVAKDKILYRDFGEGRKYQLKAPYQLKGVMSSAGLVESNGLDPDIRDLLKTLTRRTWGEFEFNGFEGYGQKSPDMWKRYTLMGALMLAYMLGASSIDVYGADMEGVGDWMGREPRTPNDQSDERWTLEREGWDCVTTWLEKHGCPVTRVLP